MKSKFLKLGTIIIAVGVAVLGFYYFMNKPVSKETRIVEFTIKSGTNKLEIINQLSDDDIIKNRFAGYIFIVTHPNINLQAGIYDINLSHKMSDILKQIGNGTTNKYAESVRITFKEGKTFRDLAKIIAANFKNISEEEFIKTAADNVVLNKFIDKYWFLTDEILNDKIYFPLEGYMFPETYDFYISSSSEEILTLFLNQTEKKLNPYKDQIEASGTSVHKLLTKASIAEKEANTLDDRKSVVQVINKRMSIGMNLGMDTTTFYSVGKEMTDKLTKKDLAIVDGYNTRNLNFIGLPVGPICNPGDVSITAALNPSDTEYIYFYAVNGKDYFFETSSEFYNFQKNLKN